MTASHDNMPDITEYGMEWTYGEVMKDQMNLGEIPIPVVNDVQTFCDALPQFALTAVNGSNSIRVGSQRIGRDMKYANRSVALSTIALRVIQWMKGVRASGMRVVERRIWIANDGTEWDSKEACLEHNRSLDD